MADIYNTFAYHVHQRMHKDGTPMPFGFIILGLVGELGELNDELIVLDNGLEPNWDNVVSELGDSLWYFEALVQSKQLAAHLGHIERISDGKPLQHHLAKICELGKKDSWHSKPANPDTLKYHLGNVLFEIERTVEFWNRAITITTAMKQNIEKLEKRYPMGIFVEGGGVR